MKLFSFFCVFLFYSSIALAEDLFKESVEQKCTFCETKERSSCQLRCDKTAGEGRRAYDICVSKCVTKQCSGFCGKGNKQRNVTSQSSSAEFGDNEIACDKCVKKAQWQDCNQECVNAFDQMLCRDKCAKRVCVKSCPLPDRVETQNPVFVDKFKCQRCKQLKEIECGGSCGTDSQEPGHLACKLGCVERACVSECNPD